MLLFKQYSTYFHKFTHIFAIFKQHYQNNITKRHQSSNSECLYLLLAADFCYLNLILKSTLAGVGASMLVTCLTRPTCIYSFPKLVQLASLVNFKPIDVQSTRSNYCCPFTSPLTLSPIKQSNRVGQQRILSLPTQNIHDG